MSLVEAPNVTLFSMGHYLHASERRLDILNEFRKASASSFDYAADIPFICSSKYSVATRIGNSQGKLPMKDEVIDIEEHVTAMDMLQKENAAIKSKEDQKMTGENNA
ncbi:hypothetical protein QUC31_005087 [Theobroma cacao]